MLTSTVLLLLDMLLMLLVSNTIACCTCRQSKKHGYDTAQSMTNRRTHHLFTLFGTPVAVHLTRRCTHCPSGRTPSSFTALVVNPTLSLEVQTQQRTCVHTVKIHVDRHFNASTQTLQRTHPCQVVTTRPSTAQLPFKLLNQIYLLALHVQQHLCCHHPRKQRHLTTVAQHKLRRQLVARFAIL